MERRGQKSSAWETYWRKKDSLCQKSTNHNKIQRVRLEASGIHEEKKVKRLARHDYGKSHRKKIPVAEKMHRKTWRRFSLDTRWADHNQKR